MNILQIISRIRNSFKHAEKIYTNGSCVQFAMILLEIFPKGKILYNSDHAIFELDGRCYDITGEVEKTNHIPIEEYGLLQAFDLMKNTEIQIDKAFQSMGKNFPNCMKILKEDTAEKQAPNSRFKVGDKVRLLERRISEEEMEKMRLEKLALLLHYEITAIINNMVGLKNAYPCEHKIGLCKIPIAWIEKIEE